MATQSIEAQPDIVYTAATENDKTALRALFDDLLDSWARGDGYAYAAHFTEDADYVAFDGSHTKGRQAIGQSHQELFQKWLKGSRLIGSITDLRLLSSDVALIHATGSTIMPGHTEAQARRPSIQTFVAVKEHGAWRFTAFHNTRIQKWNIVKYILFGIATRVFRR